MLVVVAQAAFLLVARETAGAAVDAAARAAARSYATAEEETRLLEELVTAVPGAIDPEVMVVLEGATATARATFRWRPPGPDMLAVEVTVVGSAPVVLPP